MNRHGCPEDVSQGRANDEPKPEGPRCSGVLGEGLRAHTHRLADLDERRKLSQLGLGHSPGEKKDFFIHFCLLDDRVEVVQSDFGDGFFLCDNTF